MSQAVHALADRATYSDALAAWCGGDFERCLELCDTVGRGADVAFLRARALLRLGRAGDAQRELLEAAPGTPDAALTAQLLLGAAEIRLGDVDAGLARLDAAQIAAVTAHPTIRSEIALYRALGHYARREYAAASAALRSVTPDSDIVYARALEYRGWIDVARGRRDGGVTHFVRALEQLDRCRHRDRFLETNALRALSHLASETFDAGLWSFVNARAARLDWNMPGIAAPRWWIMMNAALVHEAAGDVVGALGALREADRLAPSAAYRVHALCRRAAIAHHAGEPIGARCDVDEARALLDGLSAAELAADARTAALSLAEELARAGDALGAARYRGLYASLPPVERDVAIADDPRLRAHEQLVEAAIARAAGDVGAAATGLRAAFEGFRRVGYTRRAAEAAFGMAQITGDDEHYRYVVDATRDVAPGYWLRRAVDRRARYLDDPAIGALRPRHREVLAAILAGRTNAEIARVRGCALSTVEHAVTDLLAALGVSRRSELVAEAVRRGLS